MLIKTSQPIILTEQTYLINMLFKNVCILFLCHIL